MKVTIEKQVLENHPDARVGYLLANVEVLKEHSYVEALKSKLYQSLEEKGLDACNFVAHKNIAVWRELYQNEFKVKAKSFKSSIESLVKRVILKKEMF